MEPQVPRKYRPSSTGNVQTGHALRGLNYAEQRMMRSNDDYLIIFLIALSYSCYLLLFRREYLLRTSVQHPKSYGVPHTFGSFGCFQDFSASEGRMRRGASLSLLPHTTHHTLHAFVPPPLPGRLRLAPTCSASPSLAVSSGESIVSQGQGCNWCCPRTHKFFFGCNRPCCLSAPRTTCPYHQYLWCCGTLCSTLEH